MPSVLKNTLRNPWFVSSLHAALWLLFGLVLLHLGGSPPDFHESDAVGNPPQSPAPVAGLERLFLPGIWPQSLTDTNQLNPFYTTAFIPPAPPPPTTRKLLVTYQGFYQIGEGIRQTNLKLDDAVRVAPIGAQIAPELFIANATMHALTLTNLGAQTNTILLNTNKEIIVPLK
jgi:hypothetical protein